MRKNIVKIRAIAFALGAATIFSVTGPAFGGRGFQVEAATNKEESERKEWIKQEKKIMKVTYDSILDGLLEAFPNRSMVDPTSRENS